MAQGDHGASPNWDSARAAPQMMDPSLQILIGIITAVPFIVAFYVGRFISRRRDGREFRRPQSLDAGWSARWLEQGWLKPECPLETLPESLSLAETAAEWARVDPEILTEWRLTRRESESVDLPEAVATLWQRLSPEAAERTTECLRGAIEASRTWWSDGASGWTGRPLIVLASHLPRKPQGLPLVAVDDLTAAPVEGPLTSAAAQADGPELVLLWAVHRRAAPAYTHPLATGGDQVTSIVRDMSGQVARDLGKRMGSRLGGALGPLGSMVGGYLGGLAGSMGSQKLAEQMVPEGMESALDDVTDALGDLGELVHSEEMTEALELPEAAIIRHGGQLEAARQRRARRLRERIWPTGGLALGEECIRLALDDLQGYRDATGHFLKAAQKAPPAVAGGLLLQNPWLCSALPEGPERITVARRELNAAAAALNRARHERTRPSS